MPHFHTFENDDHRGWERREKKLRFAFSIYDLNDDGVLSRSVSVFHTKPLNPVIARYIGRFDKTKAWRHHLWGSHLLIAFVIQISGVTSVHFILLPGTFGSSGQNGWRQLWNWATSLVGEQSLQRGRLWWGDVSLKGFHTYLCWDSICFAKCALFNQQVIKGLYEH